METAGDIEMPRPPALGRIALTGAAGERRRRERRERRWIAAAQAGSRDALESLFREHWPRALRASYLIVHDAAAAEDIAQEAFLAAVRNLDRFDRQRPFGPWLHRIVVNRAIDWTRVRKYRREVQLDPLGAEPPAADPPPGAAGMSDELMSALAVLSPDHRAVVVLRYLLELTPAEIAATLELPRGTVNSRLRRALDQLAAAYGKGE
jgi:RNA polymerase sigma-70 factor (ECF subfamily)